MDSSQRFLSSDFGGASSIHDARNTSGLRANSSQQPLLSNFGGSFSSHDAGQTPGLRANARRHPFSGDFGAASSSYDVAKTSGPGMPVATGMPVSNRPSSSRDLGDTSAPARKPEAAGVGIPTTVSKPSTLGEDELRAQLDAICRGLSLGSV